MENTKQYDETRLKQQLQQPLTNPTQFDETEQSTIIALALDILAARHMPGSLLSSPEDTTAYLRLKFADYKNEVFCVIFLDNRNRVLTFEEMFQGTINGASVHPRVIVQRALELNSAAAIFVHNHPSGVSEPSQADEQLTRRLKDALALVDIRVLDHIVVGVTETTSFAQRGLI
jgi:DNA repair protein RadC